MKPGKTDHDFHDRKRSNFSKKAPWALQKVTATLEFETKAASAISAG